jgi:Ser/Thr protein kinase RdoA (MazF antagonist)
MPPHPTGPAATDMPENLLAVVSEHYGMHASISARRLTGGYANDVFLLEGLDLVLHLKHPPADLDSLSWEHRLLGMLADRLPEVPSPLPERNGSTFFLHDKQPVWLMPFRPGSPARPSDRRAVGAALGRLHAMVIDLPSRPGHARLRDLPIPPLREMPPTFDRWLGLIAQARTDLIRLVSQIDRSRRPDVGITHNDIFPGNVLVQDGSVTALLDWEEADIDWLVWDLAASLWSFCDPADWRPGIADFVAGYRDGGGRMPGDDEDLILPLVRAKRILEVLRAPTDRQPRWDLQLANLEAYQALG